MRHIYLTALFLFATVVAGHCAETGKAAAAKEAALKVADGFRAEVLRTAGPDDGSWVCMTVDSKGRLIVSPQEMRAGNTGGLLRFTLRDGAVEKMERIELPVGAAMGLLYAFDSLYVSGKGPQGTGIYRLTDTNGDDQLDDARFLTKIDGGGEHGPHALVLGPDKSIYMINGNFTKLPEHVAENSPHRNYREDLLLPRQWDANGFAVGILAPGGYVARSDADCKTWTLVAAGFRNAYDMAFNPDGELFTFDSDMEWDIGSPWYRPTRINHVVSGAEFGWRGGTAKWPVWYPDSLPGTLDMGIGSPTGVAFGTKSDFPEKYRRSLFACDWAYGKIFAVHLAPRGASYGGTSEVFLSGSPLNVTDVEFGHDGAMYFITGGRGTQSKLYRVTYAGREKAAKNIALTSDRKSGDARRLLRKLESFHGKAQPVSINFIWPHLGSDDRWIRYAARVALESQDIALWRDRALKESRPNASLSALLALARTDGRETQEKLIASLCRLGIGKLSESQQLEAFRVAGLSFIRMGKSGKAGAAPLLESIDPLFPAASEPLNRELVQLLVYLDAPRVTGRALALLAKAPSQEEQIHYAFVLRNVRTGWTIDERKQYFEWFEHAAKVYKGGASFAKFLINIKNDAIATLNDDERAALASLIAEPAPVAAITEPPVKRDFVKEWTMDDFAAELEQPASSRTSGSGNKVFKDAGCITCHRISGEGGSNGPDLTGAGSRFNAHDLLEAILLPSKVVSDQYQNVTIVKKDGSSVTGRILGENAQTVVISPDPLTLERIELDKTTIESRYASKVSPMPEGLMNFFTKEEIVNLIGYVETAGKKKPAKK